MADKEPTEMVSCGKCQQVNTVPFGLDKFKCYNCGATVAIAREVSAACCAASSTALRLQESLPTAPIPVSGGVSAGSGARSSTAEKKSSGGFFGKLQKTVSKSMEKVEKTFEQLSAGTEQDNVSRPSEARRSAPAPASVPTPTPALTSEEEQLQWALRASLESTPSQSQRAAVDVSTVPVGGAAPAALVGERSSSAAAVAQSPSLTSIGANASDSPQAATAADLQRLQAAEARTRRAEQELVAARTREAHAAVERETLRNHLVENEGLIRGLTEQLDAVNTQLDAQTQQCQALESAVVTAQDAAHVAAEAAERRPSEGAAATAENDMDTQGTVHQLLQRIAELESTLQRATHFATPTEIDNGSASSACAENVESAHIVRGAGVDSTAIIADVGARSDTREDFNPPPRTSPNTIIESSDNTSAASVSLVEAPLGTLAEASQKPSLPTPTETVFAKHTELDFGSTEGSCAAAAVDTEFESRAEAAVVGKDVVEAPAVIEGTAGEEVKPPAHQGAVLSAVENSPSTTAAAREPVLHAAVDGAAVQSGVAPEAGAKRAIPESSTVAEEAGGVIEPLTEDAAVLAMAPSTDERDATETLLPKHEPEVTSSEIQAVSETPDKVDDDQAFVTANDLIKAEVSAVVAEPGAAEASVDASREENAAKSSPADV